MSWTRVRLLRLTLLSLGAVLATVLLLLGAISLVVVSEAGSRRVSQIVFDRLNRLQGFELRAGAISGNLLVGLTLTDVELELPAASVRVASVRASWNPYSILSGSFYLSELDLAGLSVNVLPRTGEPVELSSLLQLSPLPVDLAIGNLRVADFTLHTDSPIFSFDQLTVGARLDGQQLHLQGLHLDAPSLRIESELQAQLAGDIPIQASVNWEYQGALFADYELAVGSASITGELDALNIEHELLAPETIHSSGMVLDLASAARRSLDFTHTTDSLRLPFAVVKEFLFTNPRLITRWAGSDVLLELDSTISSEILPELQGSAQGSLRGASLQIDAIRLATESGILNGNGDVHWSGDLQTSFAFDVNEQSPLRYIQDSLPVDLKDIVSSGSVNLELIEGKRHVALVVDSFRGMISDYELIGAAALRMVDADILIDSLQFNTIDNRIAVTGEYSDVLDIEWQIDAPALNQILSGISGAVSGSGNITGPLDNPGITARLQAKTVETNFLFIDDIAINLSGDRAQLRSEVSLDDLDIFTGDSSNRIDQALLQLQGNLESHTLRASLESEYGDLFVTLAGGISDTSSLSWQGTLNDARLRSDFGNWQLQGGPAALILSQDASRLPETCWQLQETVLCVKLTQQARETFQVAASLQNFPLSDFNADTDSAATLLNHPAIPQLPRGISLDGSVAINVSGELEIGQQPQLSFDLMVDDAVLNIVNTVETDAAITEEIEPVSTQQYSWDVLRVNGLLGNGAWLLSGNAELSQQDIEGTGLGLRGLIDSSLTIASDGSLNGTTIARFAELGWLQAFLPEISGVTGNLSGEVDVTGSLTSPLFAGEIDLNDGSATVEALGVSFDGIRGNIRTLNTGQVQLTGEILSNTGKIEFSGEIQDLYENSRQMQLDVSGERFHLANLPDVNLEVSPRLSLRANSQLIHLSGNLDIPLLNLVLVELPETAVDISRDTVVVSYPPDRPELARSIAASQSTLFDIPVSAEINLTLGESVAVSGFGMSATLDGDLNIQQQADGRNLTYGELSIIEGNYRIYGQELNLNQGKLLFFGALDNPALDIRAVREVENLTVGVLMNGTLKSIRSQLFSTPALPDNDIISVLVTGRPYSELGQQDGAAVLGAIASLGLDRGEGLTTQIRDSLGLDTFGINSTGNINSSMLTIGKYLTPDIFIHYGVGLFDRQSKVAIDYSLSERIKLQAESGDFQSLDITYRVER